MCSAPSSSSSKPAQIHLQPSSKGRCLSPKKNELLIPRVQMVVVADGGVGVLILQALALLGSGSGYPGGRTSTSASMLLAPTPFYLGLQHSHR